MTHSETFNSNHPIKLLPDFSLKSFSRNFRLLKILVIKDLSHRYQRSVLGILWSLINPLATAAVFYLVFKTAYGSRANFTIPYGPYVLSGTIVFAFLGNGIVSIVQSQFNSASIFVKFRTYPPIFILANAIALCSNLLLGTVPLIIWNLLLGGRVTFLILFLPIFLLLICLFVTGISLFAFNLLIRFGDTTNLLMLGTNLSLYVTPVLYPISVLSVRAQFWVNLNPVTHLLNVYRGITISSNSLSLHEVIFSTLLTLTTFYFGLWSHRLLWKKGIALI